MTAYDLIADIFRRNGPWNNGLPANVRSITGAQLDLLRRLIGQDKDAGAVESGGPGETIWTPATGDKYVIAEDLRGDRRGCSKRHTIERLPSTVPVGMGSLF